MRLLYLDCAMGAAGDMLCAALLELHPDPEGFVARFNALGIPGVELRPEKTVNGGVSGTHVHMLIHGEEEGEAPAHPHHHHRHLSDVESILDALPLPEAAARDVKAVYASIAGAEARVHGREVSEVHFHEVGALDAIADVAAVCLLIHELKPDRVCASPIHVGSGTVKCAHGVLPVPAPATALLLEGLPICGGELRGELCTPTGAALLRRFVRDFGPLPPMRLEKLGSGLGTKTFDRPNCLRAFLGEAEDASDRVLELQCNLDDMTGEEIAFASERLLEAGALDVWTQAIQMKKGRPGVLLGVLCRPDRREELLRCLFLHTSTLGVRESEKRRAVLDREERCEDGPLGPVRVKRVSGWGTLREKTEYEDLRRLALEQGLSLRQARALAEGGSDPAEIH